MLGGAKTSLVILLDDSYSMSAGAGAASNFTQAKEAAAKLIEQAGSGSDVAVILMGGTPRQLLEAPTLDTVRVTKALAQLEANFGAVNFTEALELSANVAAQMQHGLKEFVVISDFQKVSFSEGEAAARGRALQTLKRLPIPPRLTFLHVGTESRDNVAVESLELPKLALGVNQPLQVRATLRNFGERAWPDLRVYFRSDGRERGAQQIALAPGEQRQVLFPHAFDTAGFHTLEVTADADALKADNSLAAVVNGKWVVMRVPYPIGYFAKGMDGRIDDPKAGWKGKGVWTTWGTRTPFHSETGKGTMPKVVHFQIRPNPLAS